MGVFEKTKTNWKYIFILMIFTVFVGGMILGYAYKVGKDISKINQHIYYLSHENK